MDSEELVGADAEAAIAEPLGDLPQIPDLSIEAVKEDKIIAATMHLGKRNLGHFPLNLFTLLRVRARGS
jgi:hypothetical protein